MNSAQIVFLVFVFMPPILSILIDRLTGRINDLRLVKWSESILVMYLVEIVMIGLMLLYLLLGDL
jgi:hypothetical protein